MTREKKEFNEMSEKLRAKNPDSNQPVIGPIVRDLAEEEISSAFKNVTKQDYRGNTSTIGIYLLYIKVILSKHIVNKNL